jgi:hypothetical protein
MRLSTVAINRRTTVVIMLILVITLGLIAYQRLPREAAPDIQIPNIMVMSRYEGASPSDIESLVTRPIERKLKSLSDIKEMRSTSSEGNSMIMIEFQPETDIDFALQKVRDKVDEAKGDLPADLDDPTVKEISASDIFPVLYVMVSGDIGLKRLKDIAEDLGMHESTIGRVTTSKYAQTPHGIFELKYFFNSRIRRVQEEDIASEAVRAEIKGIVGVEDPRQPMSDQQIVRRLADKGIVIARRTVAKYRESLGILSSSRRRKPY